MATKYTGKGWIKKMTIEKALFVPFHPYNIVTNGIGKFKTLPVSDVFSRNFVREVSHCHIIVRLARSIHCISHFRKRHSAICNTRPNMISNIIIVHSFSLFVDKYIVLLAS